MPKAKAGTVVIKSQGGRLRLVWTYLTRRHTLCLRLVDQPSNRAIAARIAAQIQQDIALNQFDPTYERYRNDRRSETVLGLFERFIDYKKKTLAPTTLTKYRVIAKQSLVETKLGQKPLDSLTIEDCIKFRDRLSQRIKPNTLRDRLTIIKSCWDWAEVSPNPWREVVKATRVPSEPPPKPFTSEELKLLLETCRAEYPFYGDFLEFWATLGCRPGELLGLQWQHISDDFSTIWIGSQLTRRGERKAAKTGKSEALKIPHQLSEILKSRGRGSPTSLVFANGAGNRISDTNFRKRVWVKLLEKCELEYRKPYSLRATAITRFIEAGMPPAEVARITRNSVRVIYENYLGSTTPEVSVPELL